MSPRERESLLPSVSTHEGAASLILRRPDPDDRRGVRVELTPAGRELVDRAIEARLAEASRIESTLDSGEAEELGRLLARVERGLADLGPAGEESGV